MRAIDMPPDALGPRLLTGLAKLGMVLKSQAWQDATPQGLTPTQSQILALLRARADATGIRLSEIAQGLGVTPATASDAVASLVSKGLVEKRRAADDARARAIQLTPEGRQKAEEMAGWPDFLLAALGDLSPEEEEVFLMAILKMIRSLQEQARIPVSRMCATCTYFQAEAHPGSDRPHHCALVDTPLGKRDLRVDCPDHGDAEPAISRANWQVLGNAR